MTHRHSKMPCDAYLTFVNLTVTRHATATTTTATTVPLRNCFTWPWHLVTWCFRGSVADGKRTIGKIQWNLALACPHSHTCVSDYLLPLSDFPRKTLGKRGKARTRSLPPLQSTLSIIKRGARQLTRATSTRATKGFTLTHPHSGPQ